MGNVGYQGLPLHTVESFRMPVVRISRMLSLESTTSMSRIAQRKYPSQCIPVLRLLGRGPRLDIF